MAQAEWKHSAELTKADFEVRVGRSIGDAERCLHSLPIFCHGAFDGARLDIAVNPVADHPVALDQLANAVIEAVRRSVAGRLDARVRYDIIALVGVFADRRFEILEVRARAP